MAVGHLLLLLAATGDTPTPTATIDLTIERARSARGVFHICLTAKPSSFPDCSKDQGATRLTIPATSRTVRLPRVRPGNYALTLFHDENANARLDTVLGVPREGFGFSRNPVIRFGAPKFRQVVIQLAPGINRHTLRLRYLL